MQSRNLAAARAAEQAWDVGFGLSERDFTPTFRNFAHLSVVPNAILDAQGTLKIRLRRGPDWPLPSLVARYDRSIS